MQSPLYSSPLNNPEEDPYKNHSYGTGSTAEIVASNNYQNELKKKRAANPDGYFSQRLRKGGVETIYDKALYGQNEKGHLTFHENTHTRKDGKIVRKQLDVPKARTEIVKNDKPVVKEKPATTPAPKDGGSIDLKKYKGGGLQTQNFGKNPENITIGHGPSTAKGDLSLQKGNNDMVNKSYANNIGSANDLKISSPKPGGGVTNSSSLIPKGGFGGGKLNVSGRPDFAKTNKMLENSVKPKANSSKPKATSKPKAEKKQELQKMTPRPAAEIEVKAPGTTKIETTVKNAMDPSHKLVESGRVGRVRRRQEKRTANVKRRLENKRENLSNKGADRDKIKTIRETNRQERKDLKQDMPVDKDATGGRFKTDKATKKLVKDTSKQAKKDNAMKRASTAVEAGDKKALRKSGVAGKFKRAGKQDIKAANKAKAKEKSANSKPSSGYSASQKSFQNDMKNTFETPKQETNNLKKDNPVDKDATGGRASSKPFDYSQSSKKNRKRYA